VSETKFTATDADKVERKKGKPRPRGTLPYLPDEQTPEALREWLTLAFRPLKGYKLQGFERLGREKNHPATLTFRNGREDRTYRFGRQGDLAGRNMRTVVLAVTDGELQMPHLTGSEIEDVWAMLCTLGRVATEHDEVDEAREWIEALLPVTLPLVGYSLVSDSRHDALMALRHAGEFTRGDAEALRRGGDERYQQRPARLIDSQTGEQWLRAGEVAAYVRWVLGVEPLAHSTLRARLAEIGIKGRYYEDRRRPHPKLALYRLSEAFVEFVEGEK
jgi:hypothetical protein